MSIPVAVWQERFRIRSYEVDAARRATMQTVCNLFQEAAGNQCHAAGVSIEQIVAKHRETWMLHRLCVRVNEPARWRDEVTVETWPCGVERLYAIRDFRMLADDGRVLALGTSAWLVIDLETRRPTRHPKTPLDWTAGRERAMPEAFRGRIGTPEAFTHAKTFEARRSDIDVNGHVNHVNVIEWALEAVPLGESGGGYVASLDVEFAGEAFEGDVVSARCVAEGDGWLHRVVREGDGREILKARSTRR